MTPPLQQLAPHESVSDSPGAPAVLTPTAALVYLLEQFEAVLHSLNDEEYAALSTGPIHGSIGAHLITPELERTIDAIAGAFEGFFFGRFDVRQADPEALQAGRDFAIVELNGATSESTNIYDPSWSLWSAYGVLFRQWSLLFSIGAMNRRAGVPAASLAELTRRTWAHYRDRRVDPVSD